MKDHAQRAVELFKMGYNCSQAVFGAYCEEFGIDLDTGMKLSSSFGGGMGRMREVCGAVSGMFMAAGLKYGYCDPKDKDIKRKHYELIQELAGKFKEQNGSIICRELLGLDKKENSTNPSDRNQTFYKKRPCAECVRCAAEILDETIKERENGKGE